MKTTILVMITILAAGTQVWACDGAPLSNVQQIAAIRNHIINRNIQSASFSLASQSAIQAIDRLSPQYSALNAIGIVSDQTGKIGGTAFMVGPCEMLTNLHTIFQSEADAKSVTSANGTVNKTVYFSAGQTGSKAQPFTLQNVPGQVIAYGDFWDNSNLETSNSDWAVVKVSKNVAAKVGTIPLCDGNRSLDDVRATLTINAGYPSNQTDSGRDLSQIYGNLNCNVLSMELPGYLTDNCLASSGQSGSPLIQKDSNGNFCAVGMESSTPSGATNDYAVSFDSGASDGVTSEGDKIRAAINNTTCD